ncbi:MAG: helix-turn-helix domain-containing protein [Rhodothermales bacterium]|nr:helix-turn-helix domain-containing protein [Rhodothermales bacterium]
MDLDADLCYSALSARDARFDGKFFVGVTSTGIYCRPVCPARLPARRNCQFYASAAAAEVDGFRPCLRCRPELAPGRAPVDASTRLARTARARIESGALDDAPLASLATELSVSERQIRRAVKREYGASPIELAQTHRLLSAKRLLTESNLTVTQVAFSSGFSSVRRFNALFRDRYRMSPSDVRRNSRTSEAAEGVLRITLAFRPPLDWDAMLGFLSARAIRGVETIADSCYSRTVRLGESVGWITAHPPDSVRNRLTVSVSTGLAPELVRLVPLLRALFDLDAEPDAVSSHLSKGALAGAVGRRPGLRVPGSVDGFELAVRAVLGQQVSVAGASTLTARLVERFADPVPVDDEGFAVPGLTRYPVAASRLRTASIEEIAAIGIPAKRAECLSALAAAATSGHIDLRPVSDAEEQRRRLLELPGIGPWTADYIAMRALHWPDAFPAGDLGLRKAAERLALNRSLTAEAEAWRPWRSYAAMHMWQSLHDNTGGP